MVSDGPFLYRSSRLDGSMNQPLWTVVWSPLHLQYGVRQSGHFKDMRSPGLETSCKSKSAHIWNLLPVYHQEEINGEGIQYLDMHQ